MTSVIPVAIIAGIWYHLAQQGITTTTVWLGCNLLDTLRALRLFRPNGRAVGQRTRRKAIRDALICWVSFVTIQQFGAIPDKLLGWLPVYSLIRTIVVAGFLFARVSASETIYNSIIRPTLKRYETPIDLSIELVSSIVLLVYYFTLQYPLSRLRLAVQPYTSGIALLLKSAKGPDAHVSTPSSDEVVVTPTQTDVDAQRISEDDAKAQAVTVKPSPGSSKIQTLIAECEKRSPLRPTSAARSDRVRVQTSKPADELLKSNRTSAGSVSTQTTRRAIPHTTASTSSTAREASRPTTLRPVNAQAKVPRAIPRQPAVQRTAPTAKDANIRADPPLVKSKSITNLKPKPYITDIIPQRPTKSAPTRRAATKAQVAEDPDSPRAKKLAHAAERAREIRERRRREPGPTPGEKRPPPVMSGLDGPGSKRTRITVARD